MRVVGKPIALSPHAKVTMNIWGKAGTLVRKMTMGGMTSSEDRNGPCPSGNLRGHACLCIGLTRGDDPQPLRITANGNYVHRRCKLPPYC